MSQLILMIAKIDDADKPEMLTEVWRQALPEVDMNEIAAESYLNELEGGVTEVGWEAMRHLMVEQWRETDKVLVERFRQEQEGGTVGDGYDMLKVASRIGVVKLPRQVCYMKGTERHVLPGNAGLPEHEGQVTTRGLQEWVCLLPQDLAFGTTERLLGWMTHDRGVMSETQTRRWVCQHGQIIRQAELAEVKALEQQATLEGLQALVCPAQEPRRPAAWDMAINQAVETALAQAEPKPPAGISASDWERVMQARQAETTASVESLRRLGPQVQPGEVVASVDEILVRRPAQRRFLQLGTAHVRTAEGYRYLSGNVDRALRQLFLLLVLSGGGVKTKVILLGDGARWISAFFQERLATWPMTALLLDWFHCRKKCYELTSMICRGKKAKVALLGSLLLHLWRGQVQDTTT